MLCKPMAKSMKCVTENLMKEKIGRFNYPVVKAVEQVWIIRYLIDRRIIILIYNHHCAVGDTGWPVTLVLNDLFKCLLCFLYFIKVAIWISKQKAEPFSAADGGSKIEMMKNGLFFFIMKYGKIIDGSFVCLHW